MTPLFQALAATFWLVLFPADPAPVFAQAPATAEEEAKEEVKRLEKWPEVDEKTVKTDIERLRKARTREMGVLGRVALVEAGAGVVPLLLPKLGVEKDKAAIGRIVTVLDSVTGAPHTRLLAEYFDHRSIPIHTWALRRAALFPDPGILDSAEKAFAKASGRKKRKYDKDEVLAAALCTTSAGSFVGFEILVQRAAKHWGESGKAIHTALTALRGAEATERVAALLAEDSRQSKVAALRLLAACGEGQQATSLVAPLLDSSDNSLRVGAINALRGIVDGDPPLDKLSVFEAIERAKKWKSRV
jgi:hypothetical protein